MESILVLLVFIAYFFPAILAFSRSHHNATAIAVLNVFLGWTLIGWVLALVWAVTNSPGGVARV